MPRREDCSREHYTLRTKGLTYSLLPPAPERAARRRSRQDQLYRGNVVGSSTNLYDHSPSCVSSLCWPRVGGGRRIGKRSPSTRMGEASIFSVPAAGCSTSRNIPELSTCPSENTSARVFTGPQGTPARRISSVHSSAVFLENSSSRIATRSSRFATRSGLLANRSSSASSSRPSALHRFSNWVSLPTARAIFLS